MNCSDFFESYMDNNDWNTLCDEMYWDQNFDSEYCFKKMKELAKKQNIFLIDQDIWDYDSYFYTVYKNTEKGLS